MSLAHATPIVSWHELPEMTLAYGPLQSRRLGRSLGVNPFGSQKICSFNCAFCELGPSSIRMNQLKKDISFPSVEEIEESVRQKLRDLQAKNETIDHLTVSGNGEPTLYPHLLELTERLLVVRSEMTPNTPLVIFTNGIHIDTRKMVQTLDMYDERMIKVDAGSDRDLKTVNSPLVRANMAKIISGARKLKNCIVQSLFIQGSIENTNDSSIADWMEVLGMIAPKMVHIYSLQRKPHNEGLFAVDEDTLYVIASKLKRRTQLESKVFT